MTEGKTLETFDFGEGQESLVFQETMAVVPGVECDVYSVKDDNSKDLGIIRIDVDAKTPLQKVLKGESTIEGYIGGEGWLVLTRQDGSEDIYPVSPDVNQDFKINVGIGEKMQWIASEHSSLTAFEICYPPYEDGRYENL